jgi:hypothetical protein
MKSTHHASSRRRTRRVQQLSAHRTPDRLAGSPKGRSAWRCVQPNGTTSGRGVRALLRVALLKVGFGDDGRLFSATMVEPVQQVSSRIPVVLASRTGGGCPDQDLRLSGIGDRLAWARPHPSRLPQWPSRTTPADTAIDPRSQPGADHRRVPKSRHARVGRLPAQYTHGSHPLRRRDMKLASNQAERHRAATSALDRRPGTPNASLSRATCARRETLGAQSDA